MPALIRVLNLCTYVHSHIYFVISVLCVWICTQTYEHIWNIYGIFMNIQYWRAFILHEHSVFINITHTAVCSLHIFSANSPGPSFWMSATSRAHPACPSHWDSSEGGAVVTWRVWMVGVTARPSMGCSGITTTKVGSENWAANHHPEIPEASCEPCRISGPL